MRPNTGICRAVSSGSMAVAARAGAREEGSPQARAFKDVLCHAVAQHEKVAGRPLSSRQLPIFSAATWMTSLILQNFYGTLQVQQWRPLPYHPKSVCPHPSPRRMKGGPRSSCRTQIGPPYEGDVHVPIGPGSVRMSASTPECKKVES